MMNNNYYYSMPTKIYFGRGFIHRLKEVAGKNKKIFLVTGRSFLKRTGWLKKIKNILKGNTVKVFDMVFENPDVELIETGIRAIRSFVPDLVIGIGGGSVLDSAKAIALLSKNKGSVISFLNKKECIKKAGIQMIAVPTTAGSSSEITPYSVITVKNRGIKITLASEFLYPFAAVMDPDILKGLSKNQIANSGIDVLCHAIESYWNINSNPISGIFALESIKLVFLSLKKFYRDPSSRNAATQMALASMFAGLAFSNTRTTACHSISYPLTTVFNVAHGQACAISLPQMLIYNSAAASKRIKDICSAVGAKTPEGAAKKISALMKRIGLKTRLSDLGMKMADIGIILDKGFTPERMICNPRNISRSDMMDILNRSF